MIFKDRIEPKQEIDMTRESLVTFRGFVKECKQLLDEEVEELGKYGWLFFAGLTSLVLGCYNENSASTSEGFSLMAISGGIINYALYRKRKEKKQTNSKE